MSMIASKGDFSASLQAGWDAGLNSALTGAGIGFGAGGFTGYKYAKANNLDLWNGKSLNTNSQNSTPTWNYGDHKSQTKWKNQMNQRGWTEQQISEAMISGKQYSAPNNINPNNGATRYIQPNTGRSVVIDNITGSILHVGGDGFKY